MWHDFEFDLFVPVFEEGTGPYLGATFNPDTQLFHWDTFRSPLGIYQWTVQATNEFGSDTATMQVFLIVPEPSSASFVLLGLFGLAGVRRRRRSIRRFAVRFFRTSQLALDFCKPWASALSDRMVRYSILGLSMGPTVLAASAFAQSPPDIANYHLEQIGRPEVIDLTWPLHSGSPPIVWHDFKLHSFLPFGDGTGAYYDPTFDYDTQLFHWDTHRSSLGWYFWTVQASNEFGTDTGTLSVLRLTPEPTTLAIWVIGMLGVASVRRHRC
jgi:MYXO-CTERM domain-containing protein